MSLSLDFMLYVSRKQILKAFIGDPLPPIASLTVAIGENQATLQLAKGESIEGAVRRFCSTHGVDLAENGPMLEQALSARLEDTIREEQGAGRVEEDEKEKTFLFSIPISINGTEVKLSVHEGDKLEPLVTNFCGKLLWIGLP